MVLGMEVPTVYIVPVERFCRELGHALGLNFAEFEFPAYFNFFVKRKRVQLVVDSMDAEQDIRTVFGETLLGPEIFRDQENICENADEDFDPSFPKDARPNFYKEFQKFRMMENGIEELSTDTLLEFIHFQRDRHAYRNSREGSPILGVPPKPRQDKISVVEESHRTTSSDHSDGDMVPRPLTTELRRKSVSTGTKLQSAPKDDSVLTCIEKEPVRGVRRNLSDDGKMITHVNPNRRGSDDSIQSLQLSGLEDDHGGGTAISNLVTLSLNASAPSLMNKSLNLASGRRDSAVSANSDLTNDADPKGSRHTRASRLSAGSLFLQDFSYDFLDDANNLQDSHWLYSQAKWLGEVATVYPPDATEEEKRTSSTARVEIFKMAGGTEYIFQDVD